MIGVDFRVACMFFAVTASVVMPDLIRHPWTWDHFSTADIIGAPRAATGSSEPLMLEYQKSVFAATGYHAMCG